MPSAIHTTRNCHRFDHPECQIRVSNPAIPINDVVWFLGFLEVYIASGARLTVGDTMQVGWMLTRFEEGAQDTLLVTEPDMQSFPIKFVGFVDRTLIHLRNQNDLVRSLEPPLDPEFPSLRQSVIVHPNYKQAPRIRMARNAPMEMESGWIVTDLDDKASMCDSDRSHATSLYQLALDRPDLIRFFALPPTIEVWLDDGQTRILSAGNELPIASGSYLDELNRQAR